MWRSKIVSFMVTGITIAVELQTGIGGDDVVNMSIEGPDMIYSWSRMTQSLTRRPLKQEVQGSSLDGSTPLSH